MSMVRLADLKTVIEVCGTTGHALSGGAIPEGMVRRVYHLMLQQRGATLSNVYLYKNRGATLGPTIFAFKFDVPNQGLDMPDGPIPENALPIFADIDRASYDSIFASVETASVDLFMQYADEYP